MMPRIPIIVGVLFVTFATVLSISTFEEYRYQQNDGRFFEYQQKDGQFRLENWTIDGVAKGSFGWFDADGVQTALDFIADDKGYRIIKKRNFTRIVPPGERGIGIEEDPSDPEHTIIKTNFKYITGSSFRVEEKRKTGIIYGKYGFFDSRGRVVLVNYTAHKRRGFLALREIYDPKRGKGINLATAYAMPLRDVAAEYGLKEYYRSAKE